MAVDTLILRPTDGYCDSDGGRYPETTNVDETHLLVCEEIADDDATYVVTTDILHGAYFAVTVPSAYHNKQPSSIRIKFRARDEVSGINYAWIEINGGTESMDDDIESGNLSITDAYSLYSFAIPSENMLTVWETIKKPIDNVTNNESRNYHFYIVAKKINVSSKTSSKVRITQVYLEVDFDDDTPTSQEIYFKQNGVWLDVNAQYKKVDGLWVEITSEEAKELLNNSPILITN
jgi:hypothetical protein